jgi:hypothetical protein
MRHTIMETNDNNQENRNLRKIKDELWERISFADSPYEISNYGRIKSFFGTDEEGKILSGGNINGYPVVGLRVNGRYRSYCIHKLVAEFFVPKGEEDEVIVIHKDWNKSNNYYKNLEWVNHDYSRKRTAKRLKEEQKADGRSVTNSKLRTEDILLLKKMLKNGVKQNVIAKLFAISEMQVTRIKRSENWSHISLPDKDGESN